MKRREFVRNMALASLSAPFLVNRLSAQVSPKHIFGVPDMYQDRVLVIIRMNGGNDGLNTIIPIDQYDNLMIQRPNVIIPESQILPATYKIGMHPSMSGMSNLFNDGKLSVVQNVGYPEQNRSHFRSMDIWTTGSMDNTENRGWLGRLFEQDHMDFLSSSDRLAQLPDLQSIGIPEQGASYSISVGVFSLQKSAPSV